MDFDETEGRNRSIILDRSVEVELEHAKRRTRMGMKSIGGEILQVHGGHIVRSTARKDRHSKVYTAKGPRDRRVRLSAHTAIQFYDVQDRLGYDRPSKAVDWLIRKAKSAIDKLSELPGSVTATITDPNGDEIDMVAERSESSGFNNFQFQAENLIPSPPVSAVDFRSFQNLGLSLQTLQDAAGNLEARNSPQTDQTVLYTAGSGNSTLEFDDSYERMVAWNNVLGSAPAAFSQRAPLQAAVGLPSAVVNYAWNDLSIDSAGTGQKYHPIHEHSSLSTTRYVTDELPEFDIQGRLRFDDENEAADVVSGKASSRSSVYFRH